MNDFKKRIWFFGALLMLYVLSLALPVAEGQINPGVLARPAHVVVVIEENKSFHDIIGNSKVSYINELVSQGALMEEPYAITHPSLPNYLAFFSGSTHGVRDDSCRHDFKGQNLAQSLEASGLSFVIFSETLPETGFVGCSYRFYCKKHNPIAYFSDLPAKISRPFRKFPHDFSKLPTIAFVIPNLKNDMHNGSIARGDAWLRENISPYVEWVKTHNSILILTWMKMIKLRKIVFRPYSSGSTYGLGAIKTILITTMSWLRCARSTA